MGKPDISQLIFVLRMLSVTQRDKVSENNRVETTQNFVPFSSHLAASLTQIQLPLSHCYGEMRKCISVCVHVCEFSCVCTCTVHIHICREQKKTLRSFLRCCPPCFSGWDLSLVWNLQFDWAGWLVSLRALPVPTTSVQGLQGHGVKLRLSYMVSGD